MTYPKEDKHPYTGVNLLQLEGLGVLVDVGMPP